MTVSLDDLRTVFLGSWESREKNSEITYRKGDSRKQAVDMGVQLIELYASEPPPTEIVAVEQQMIVPLHNSRGQYLEKPLVAVVDLLTRTEEGLKVIEFKTSGRAYGDFEADRSLQPTCYFNAVKEMYGESATIEFTVLVKTKTAKISRVAAVRNDDDLGRLGDLVEAIERAIAAEAFFPVESPMNCSTCAYREPCRQWGLPNKPAIEASPDKLCEVA